MRKDGDNAAPGRMAARCTSETRDGDKFVER